MDQVVSTHAVFNSATGALLFMCPGHLIPTGASSVALPDGFAERSHAWDAATRSFKIDLAAVKADRLAEIDALRDAREMALLTEGDAKALAYMHKAAEVKDYKTLGATAALIAAAVTGMTQAQRRARFPMLQAEVETSGDSFAAVVTRIETAANASVWQLALLEARATLLKRQVRAANAASAVEAINVEAGWPS